MAILGTGRGVESDKLFSLYTYLYIYIFPVQYLNLYFDLEIMDCLVLSSLAHHQQQHHYHHCRQSGRINYEQLAEIILYVEMDGGLERGRECVLQIVCALFCIENHYCISCLINEGFGIIFYIKLN